MDENNFFIKTQIRLNINDIENLLSTDVFSSDALRIFREPVFISIILKLDDLLQKFRLLNRRINFTENVVFGDITDLVNKIRNAVCHLNSLENMLTETQIKFVFNMAIGKCNVISIGETSLTSDYDDDTAFFYGENRIYLKRHMVRLLEESKNIYQNLYPDN